MTTDVSSSTNGLALEPCPSCGAPLGGRAGCQAALEDLVGRAWANPSRAAVHNLVVDAYALQHTEEYGRSAKSFVAHLLQLCCGVESPQDQRLYRGIGRWLDGPARLTRPADVPSRGRVTVANVLSGSGEDDYPELVRQWAREVWTAYSGQHEVVRQRLSAVRAAGLQSKSSGRS